MKIKSERDFWSGLMFIAVGIGFAIGATNYSMGAPCKAGEPCETSLYARFTQLSAHPGAGYFPLGLSILLTVLGAIVLFKALTIEVEGGDPVGRIAWRPLVVVVLSISVFGLTIESLGLLLAVPILIGLVSLAGDEFRWKGVVITAVSLTAFAWAVFVWGLKLTMPVLPVFMR